MCISSFYVFIPLNEDDIIMKYNVALSQRSLNESCSKDIRLVHSSPC